MSRIRKWLLYLVAFLIVASLIGLIVGGTVFVVVLVLNIVLMGIAGLIIIVLTARASERRLKNDK
jgi:bacteriorhodopsin